MARHKPAQEQEAGWMILTWVVWAAADGAGSAVRHVNPGSPALQTADHPNVWDNPSYPVG